jgi:transposase-like protein
VLTDLKLQPGCDRAKKNERIGKALAMIAEVKKKYSLSNSEIARQLGLSYETLMRWRRRLSKGQPPVEKPGRKSSPSTSASLGKRSGILNTVPDEAVERLGCMAPLKTPSPAESWSR